MNLLHPILLLLALARLLELRVAGRNTRRLLAAGTKSSKLANQARWSATIIG